MFKYNKNKMPGMFNEMFIKKINVLDHFTRQQNQLHVHKASNATVDRTLQYKGTYFWKLLSLMVKTKFSLFTLKERLIHTKYLIGNEVFLNICTPICM